MKNADMMKTYKLKLKKGTISINSPFLKGEVNE